MKRHLFATATLIAIGSFAFANDNSSPSQASDPKPPTVVDLSAAVPPVPQKNPDVTFRATPVPLAADAKVADWPGFMGVNHNLLIPETKILSPLPKEGPRAVWEMKKGSGYASVVIVGDRLILFHRVADRETIDCLKTDTGERFWRFDYPTAYVDRYGYCDGPRASPVIADGWVYAMGAEGKVNCLELATGRARWSRDLLTEFKLRPGFFGLGSTPLVEGDKLIINLGVVPGGPCVGAFDLKTGKMVWGVGKTWGMSYASPLPATIHGKRRVLVFAGGETTAREEVTGGLLCIDPANGQVDFTFPWRGNRRESVNASTPLVIGDDKIFISECYGSGGTLIEVTPDFKPKQLWANDAFGMHFMTPHYRDGYLYGVDGHGPNDAFLVCVEAATGKEMWRTQPEWQESINGRDLTMGTYRAHLLEADGQMFMLGEFGHLLRVELTPKGYVQKERAMLFAAPETWTPPVLSHGLLYIEQNSPDAKTRAEPRLICYDMRAK